MKKVSRLSLGSLLTVCALLVTILVKAEEAPTIPRFSVGCMDKGIAPDADFYRYACGTWLKNNPVPADKSRWAGFDELQERNWALIHGILDEAALLKSTSNSPTSEIGAFFASAMDTNHIQKIGFTPIQEDLSRIAALKSNDDLMRLVADFQLRNINVLFSAGASPDEKNSSIYAVEAGQGGLGLPDRDYYLSEAFAKQREAYLTHVAKMFSFIGETADQSKADAATVMNVETALAKASKSRTDLRDPIANYHKFPMAAVQTNYPDLNLKLFFDASDVPNLPEVIVGQPEFFNALDQLIKTRPLDDWKVYLRWHLLHHAAPYLHAAPEQENFAFYGTVLNGQPAQEPRWQRAARTINGAIGEALGQLFVEKYYPPTASARMDVLITDLKSVLHDRLTRLPWMSEPTRVKALEKFAVFTQKIGHPAKYRDYSKVELRRDDYLGNVDRASIFESKREFARVGKAVDKTEWHMTPQTVNAYFSSSQNEIVFPAGILQPPFFDLTMDDAVNYGGIGVVIGHEMTHGFDDQGRKFDAKGNLNEWWTEADATAFKERAQKLVDQFNGYEALPGVHVNGQLTLGENIADLGGLSIAYEALQRDLARDPSKRKIIDGFTPEQRFFLSFAQVWRVNFREASLRQRLVTDPHAPGQFRAIGAPEDLQSFYETFNIKAGSPMWRAPELRAIIW